MKISSKLLAVLFTMVLLAGCASQNQRSTTANNFLCAATGALVGGAAASAMDSDDAAVGGAVVGAMLALLLCPNDEAPAAVEPAVVAPVYDAPPAGALLDAQGCAFDSDGDGVVDGIDLCADTPAGVKFDRVGCPLDSDQDGVADYKDLCPATPLGTIVDSDGCPVAGQKILSLTGVNFSTNQAVLTDSAKNVLEEAVTLLSQTDALIEVQVEGHTDSRGTAAYNKSLSQKRVEAVVTYLISRGVNARGLVAVGMGETNPVATNTTTTGRAANRRVDFVVSK